MNTKYYTENECPAKRTTHEETIIKKKVVNSSLSVAISYVRFMLSDLSDDDSLINPVGEGCLPVGSLKKKDLSSVPS